MGMLETLSETLDTEIKGWLNPDDKADQAKIAKACIALRNHGGGQLVIGFDDTSRQPLPYSHTSPVKELYHSDKIQGIVSRYASPLFDVSIVFEPKDSVEYPIIRIPSGVQSPVMNKSTHEKEFPRQCMVVMRTFANGTVSSSEPRTPQDWDRLIKTCFENREADIGRFFRRHLSEIKSQFEQSDKTSEANTQPIDPNKKTEYHQTPSTSPEHKKSKNSVAILEQGSVNFYKRLDAWTKKHQFEKPEILGSWEVAFWIDGDIKKHSLKTLCDIIFAAQPRLTGWPCWVDSRGFRLEWCHPYTHDGGWEALVYIPNHHHWAYLLDFWRITPEGEFYLFRVPEDDLWTELRNNRPREIANKQLDFVLLIRRVAEALAVAKAFTVALGADDSSTLLHFAFRWKGLQGKEICSWFDPARDLMTTTQAVDNEVTKEFSISLDLPDSRIWEAVKNITEPVFDVFGSGVGSSIFEEIVADVLRAGD